MRDRLAQDSLVREVNVLSPQPVVIAIEDAVAYQTQGDTSEVIAYYPPEQTVGEENALVLVHPEHRDTVTVVGGVRTRVAAWRRHHDQHGRARLP